MQKEAHWQSPNWHKPANSEGYSVSFVRFRRPQLSRHIDCCHLHCCKARQQERRRKSLPVHLAVNLVWRFIYAEGFQEPSQLLVAKFPVRHLRDQHFLGSVLPRSVGDLRTQFQRSSHYLRWRCRTAHQAKALHDDVGKKSQIGHIRPNRHFSVGALPTRSHQQLL